LTWKRFVTYGKNWILSGFFQQSINDESEGDSKYLAREVLNQAITKEAIIFSLGLSILQISTDLYLPSAGVRWHEIRDLKIHPRFTERKFLKQTLIIY
jgi:hypothetical protein